MNCRWAKSDSERSRVPKIFNGSLVFVPGFLGLPADWEDVIPREDSFKAARIEQISLFSSEESNNIGSTALMALEGLAEEINKKALAMPAPRVLVGYSLGGRIALHAILKAPQLWQGAVIVSANPGLAEQNERTERLKADEIWAQKFETEAWDKLLSLWNSQGVFSTQKNEVENHSQQHQMKRREAFFSRSRLAAALRGCSLGVQEDLRPRLKALEQSILWIVGDEDLKFKSIALELKSLNSLIKARIVPQAGHRVLFDQPDLLKEQVKSYALNRAL